MPLIQLQRSIYLLNALSIFAIILRNWTPRVDDDFKAVFYNESMLEKAAMQRTQQFLDFSILLKEPS